MMNKIDQEFFKRKEIRIQPSGLWFVMPFELAIEYVNECKKERIEILGIESFIVHTPGIQPSMEHSIDFSSHNYKIKKDVYSDAIEFLNTRPVNMYFEIASENID
jgi:hypothetical protein